MTTFSFDRAAKYYDATRSLPDRQMRELVELLIREIGSGPVLEVGVGTGRIAVPLMQRGVEIFGLDISVEMIGRMLRKSFDHDLLHVALADATRLPFADNTFPIALGVHVLHLIPAWREVCEEVARVLRPQGTFFVDYGGWGGVVWEAIQMHFVKITDLERPRPGAASPQEVEAHMAALGATAHKLPSISTPSTSTYSELLDRIRDGMYSFTWTLDENARARGADETRRWAEQTYGDLDAPRDMEWVISITAYQMP
ncbi:MAG: class I SAM-dependent methyltransferase [Actinomycetota bacterium]